MSKKTANIKFIREAECEGEVMWDIVHRGESVGRITQIREDFALGSLRARGRTVIGYQVDFDDRSEKSAYVSTHGGSVSARLAFKYAKDYARGIFGLKEQELHLRANRELMVARIRADKKHLDSLFSHPKCK